MVVAMTGLEKFSYLEDKIYQVIEQYQALKKEKESLEREVASLNQKLGTALAEKDRLEIQVERLFVERDAVKLKVEAMLDALSLVEHEAGQTVRR
jgi:FtsZ-binding cell division protein ZapB